MTATPVKFAARINQRVLSESTAPDRLFDYIDIGSVRSDGSVDRPAEPITFAESPSRARRVAAPGSTIVSTVRTYLRAIAYVDDDLARSAVFSTGFAVLEPLLAFDSRYFHYACRSEPFVEEIVARSVGVSYPAIAPSDLGDLTVPAPPLHTQRRIADFLDDQVSRIDETVRLRREQIEALDARFRSFVAEHVDDRTSQLVPLRRALAQIQTGSTPTVEAVPSDSVGSIGWYTPDSFGSLGSLGEPRRHYSADPQLTVFPVDSVLFVGIGWASGRVAYLSQPGAGNQQLTALTPRGDMMLGRFLLWQMFHLGENLRRNAPFTVIPVLGNDYLKSTPVRVPSMSRQERAVRALDRAGATLAAVTAEMSAQIDLLQERKRSLITAAVTGEFDVTTASGRGV